jgi:hypothetical protein
MRRRQLPCDHKNNDMRSLVIGLSVLLASCGGGGSGGGSPSPPPPAPAPPPPPPVNQAPTITSLTFGASEDHDFSGALTATDPEGTAITFARTSDPAHGQVTSFTTAGAFTYRPAANYAGSDSFSVRATDAANAAVTATITINVANGDDDAPILRNDILQATGASPLVDVLGNDEEPDGEALTLTLVGNPDFGSATVENRKIRLNLPAGFKGFNRFQYRAVDGAGQGGVVKAVVFVDAQPSRLIYFSTTSATHGYSEVYVDDFVSTRKLTSHETTSPADDLYPYTFVRGDSGRVIIVNYKLDSAYQPINALSVVPTDGSSPPRRLTPATRGHLGCLRARLGHQSRRPLGRVQAPTRRARGEVLSRGPHPEWREYRAGTAPRARVRCCTIPASCSGPVRSISTCRSNSTFPTSSAAVPSTATRSPVPRPRRSS